MGRGLERFTASKSMTWGVKEGDLRVLKHRRIQCSLVSPLDGGTVFVVKESPPFLLPIRTKLRNNLGARHLEFSRRNRQLRRQIMVVRGMHLGCY